MVSCGLYHTACLTASGLAISFGGNESGQCGHSGSKHSRVSPKVVDFAGRDKSSVLVKQIATGDLFTVFLTSSGEVYTCGAGLYMGCEKYRDKSVPQAERVDSLLGSNVVFIAAGARHAIAVTSAGEVYVWGNGRFGQLGLGDSVFDMEGCHVQTPRRVPVELPADAGYIVGVSAGQSHTLMWTSGGMLLGCGSNKHGQLTSLSPRISTLSLLVIPGGPVFCLMAACGQNHSLVLCREEGTSSVELRGTRVLAFGSNNFGQVDGSSSATLFRNPVDITEYISPARLLYIAAGGDQSFAVGVLKDPNSEEGDSSDVTGPLLGASTSIWMKRYYRLFPKYRFNEQYTDLFRT
jgi:alpha-tubulin suppressor-like RCC1 family protein